MPALPEASKPTTQKWDRIITKLMLYLITHLIMGILWISQLFIETSLEQSVQQLTASSSPQNAICHKVEVT